MTPASQRARAIACAFALKPEHRDRLAQVIENAIVEAQREAQAWRPIDVRDQNGNPATLQLHCDMQGTKLIAFNPLLGSHFEFTMKPVIKKPVQRAGSYQTAKSAGAGSSS